MALVALGRLRARRGDPGAMALLDEALELAEASGTLQRLAPARAARAETAWLAGDAARAAREARAALPLARQHRHAWFVGELCSWLLASGEPLDPPPDCAAPHALLLAGRWREAAEAWAALGCPYEAARALAAGDVRAQLEALQQFETMGAQAMVRRLRASLQAAGLRGVPRGRRASTRSNPHGLTAREIETLTLLCQGLRNAEIAERLSRSVRTVDHHLAAIYAKLEVPGRSEAMAHARQWLAVGGASLE
jgi:DNA-binding CsgD family transcriptional regulator